MNKYLSILGISVLNYLQTMNVTDLLGYSFVIISVY